MSTPEPLEPAGTPAVPARRWRRWFRPAHDPLGANYRKLWTASAVSNLGDGVRLTALPLLAARLTRDPGQIAALSFASMLPWFLFALLAGALVDRVDRRRAMGISNIVRALLTAGLAVAVVSDQASLPVLYVVAFLLGCAETVFDNAGQSILPALVRKDQLERANGRMYAAEFITNQFVGPPLGALLFVAAAAAPFALDSATFLVSALLILSFSGRFRAPREEAAPRTTVRADIAEGLRWLWNHRLLRTLAIMLGILNGLGIAVYSIFVLFALEILEVGEVGFGILSATFVIGSVLGSFTAAKLRDLLGPGTTLITMVVGGAAASLVIALTSDPFVVGAMFVVEGFVTVVWNVITVSMRQAIIPDRLLGRVNSVYRLFGWGSMPIGAAIGGFMGATLGLRSPFFLQAGILVVMAALAVPLLNNRTIAVAQAEAEAAA